MPLSGCGSVSSADDKRSELAARVRKAITWCYELIEYHGSRIGSQTKPGELEPKSTTIAFARILAKIGLVDHAAQLPLDAYKSHQHVIELLHRYVPILTQFADKLTSPDDTNGPEQPPPKAHEPPAVQYGPNRDDQSYDRAGKIQKKRRMRQMNAHAARCAHRFREAKRRDPGTRMRQIVDDYAAEKGKSAKTIMRILNDNPDQWKYDKKATKTRPKDDHDPM
jgi:hypothetical protein